ncbi:MAG: hypothetical protein JST04_12865 [Bdellovibrionales bacterium]|nr:hypothetical protein [Bdellovibrionales bacterium]
MQPIKLTIPGQFWDSQIYSGKLFLFGVNGDVRTLKWDELVEDWAVADDLRLALKCAFSQSALLYSDYSKSFVDDNEIKSVIRGKFDRLSELNLELSSRQIEHHSKRRQDSPFPFPHSDSCIYGRKMFVATKKGIYEAGCDGKTTYPISTKVTRGWDAPVLTISASYKCLALAAGSEGLFEVKLGDNFGFNGKADPERLTSGNFTGCNWLYFSIYGSSHTTGGKLIDYRKGEENEDNGKRRFFSRDESIERVISGVRTERSIFHDQGYSWGNQDKIFLANDRRIKIKKYSPWDKENRLSDLATLDLASWKGAIVSAATAHFGSVIECENALVVLPTEGSAITIPGEPVNWRVFPRSKHYENHLHVLYQDRLEIFSFNHDYFLDQDAKLLGIKHSNFTSQRGSSRRVTRI